MMFGIKGKLYQPHLLQGTGKTLVSPCWCHTEHGRGLMGYLSARGCVLGYPCSRTAMCWVPVCIVVCQSTGLPCAGYLWGDVAVYWGNWVLGYPCEGAVLCWDLCV